jgi:hypothetical protein
MQNKSQISGAWRFSARHTLRIFVPLSRNTDIRNEKIIIIIIIIIFNRYF